MSSCFHDKVVEIFQDQTGGPTDSSSHAASVAKTMTVSQFIVIFKLWNIWIRTGLITSAVVGLQSGLQVYQITSHHTVVYEAI